MQIRNSQGTCICSAKFLKSEARFCTASKTGSPNLTVSSHVKTMDWRSLCLHWKNLKRISSRHHHDQKPATNKHEVRTTARAAKKKKKITHPLPSPTLTSAGKTTNSSAISVVQANSHSVLELNINRNPKREVAATTFSKSRTRAPP